MFLQLEAPFAAELTLASPSHSSAILRPAFIKPLFSFSCPEEKNEFLKLVRFNEDLGNGRLAESH